MTPSGALAFGIGKPPPAGTGLGFAYVDFLELQLIAVLFLAAMVPVAGLLADRFGRRAVLQIDVMLY